MDYQSELNRIEEAGNYWKPKPSQYSIKVLSEIEDTEPFVKKLEDGSTEETAQVKMKILVNGEEKIWTFSKGTTPASTYGQLIGLAVRKGNTLLNTEFKVFVVSEGNKNRYTIVD